MNDMLRIENIKKNYPSFSLKGVSFSIKPGQIMGFIGRNGAGKTTTLKCIMNLVHYESGSVYVFDKDKQSYVGKEYKIEDIVDDEYLHENMNTIFVEEMHLYKINLLAIS